MNVNEFTIGDTNFAKGIALCLMLIHHLFFYDFSYHGSKIVDIVIGGHQVSHLLSVYSKVCVAMFSILSGYGLHKSIQNNPEGLKNFYLKHLSKIYLTYWFIWAVFVPVGFVFFNRNLNTVYGNYSLLKLVIQFFGLQNFFGFGGFNPTWWFMSTCIALYLLFPLLNALTLRYRLKFVIFTAILMFVSYPTPRVDIFFTVQLRESLVSLRIPYILRLVQYYSSPDTAHLNSF
jgi:peptidoglycan/LPS O-acetylase OafA/YrhL